MALTKVSTDGVKDDAINFNKIGHIDSGRILGRVSGGLGQIETPNASQIRTLLNVADGANQTTINSNADNRLITGSGSANTLNGEANLTFNNGNLVLVGDNGITIEATSTNTAGQLTIIGVNNSNQVSAITRIKSVSTDSSSAATATTFSNRNSSNAVNEHMRIISNGKIGIGTTSPVGRLHLYEASNDPYMYIQRGSGDTAATLGGIFWKNSTNSLGLIDVQSSDINDGFMRFYTMGSGNLSERMRILASGGVTFNGDTAAANALDDYEEGTFTVTLSGNSGNYSLSSNADTLSYIKIGKMVTIFGRILITAHNNVTGTPRINLPFNSSSGTKQSGLGQISVYWHNWDVPSDGTGDSSLEFQGNSSAAYFLYHRDNSSWAGLNDIRNHMGNVYMALHGSYMAN